MLEPLCPYSIAKDNSMTNPVFDSANLTVSQQALETVLLLEGYGDEGTFNIIDRVKMVQAMDDDEIITKIELVHPGQYGCEAFIRERTTSGILTDVLQGNRGQSDVYIVLDGKIYKMGNYDLIIIKGYVEPLTEEPDHVE